MKDEPSFPSTRWCQSSIFAGSNPCRSKWSTQAVESFPPENATMMWSYAVFCIVDSLSIFAFPFKIERWGIGAPELTLLLSFWWCGNLLYIYGCYLDDGAGVICPPSTVISFASIRLCNHVAITVYCVPVEFQRTMFIQCNYLLWWFHSQLALSVAVIKSQAPTPSLDYIVNHPFIAKWYASSSHHYQYTCPSLPAMPSGPARYPSMTR